MSACDLENCEHFKALNRINGNFLAIQNENHDLKREIVLLRSGQIPCSPKDENYYQRWIETNKENQELSNKLCDSRRLVADLQPRLTHILQSIQNIEQTLDYKKENQGTSISLGNGSLRSKSSLQRGEKSPDQDKNQDKCTAVQIECAQVDADLKGDLLQDNGNFEAQRTSEYNEDEATDTEDFTFATNMSEPSSSSAVQGASSNSTGLELVPVRTDPFVLQDLPEEKPVFTECSICHENFAHYPRPDMKMFQGPPCCDKCKIPASTAPASRGITFQYPKGLSSSSKELVPAGPQDPNDLAVQYTTHVDDKPYQCQMCGKKFTRSHGLTKHIRIHTGEKPYICKICGKSFAVSGRLALHIRIHTGEKPYECKFCGKRFNESSKLKIHYRRHTGEKPFTCEVCDKGFSQMSTLTAHCRRHLTETRNQCGKCGNGFRNPNALRGHRCLQICDSNVDVQNRSETILGNDT